MSTWLDNNVKNLRYAPFIKSDAIANLPASAPLGALFVSTDTFAWYRYNGAGWDLIGGAGVGDITGSGTVGELAKFTGARVIGDAVAGVDYVKPSALAGYVPYTGATANVNLGGNNIEAANFITGGRAYFSGSSGGSNSIFYDNANNFTVQSQFDSLRLKGGVNDSNKRQIDFYTGDTQSAYIDISGTFWLSSNAPVINSNDNSLKIATTSFVKSQNYVSGSGTVGALSKFSGANTITDAVSGVDYVVPSALAGYVPYTGATANVNLGAFNASANTFISDNYQAANVGGVSVKNALGQTVALMGAGNSQGTTFNGQVNGTTLFLSNQLLFSGSSGGQNIIEYSSNRFKLLSYFDTITIQGGVNNANKRQIDFNTGNDLSAYIDITGIFWKGSSSTPIADSDNSLKFATTAFVKNQGYLTSASLNGYVPYTGATANVNLGAFDILANDGSFSGQVGIGLSTAQQANAKLEIDGGDIFMRNGYSVGFSSGISGSSGGGATMIGRAIGNNTNNGYAEFLSFYAGESAPYTAPMVFQNNGGNVLIGTTTNTSGFKLQVSGNILTNAGIRTANPGGNANTCQFGGYYNQSGGSTSVVGMAGSQLVWQVSIGGTVLYIPVWTSFNS